MAASSRARATRQFGIVHQARVGCLTRLVQRIFHPLAPRQPVAGLHLIDEAVVERFPHAPAIRAHLTPH